MQTLPAPRLSTLLAELRELPEGLDTLVNAGLVVADTLRAVGWDEAVIAAAVGVDLEALGAVPVEVLS
jgi:hypothetical protein